MIPKLLEKWCGKCDPRMIYHTLGFKTKSAAKRFLRAKGATPVADEYCTGKWHRYANGHDARLTKLDVDDAYPWHIQEMRSKQ